MAGTGCIARHLRNGWNVILAVRIFMAALARPFQPTAAAIRTWRDPLPIRADGNGEG